MAYIDWDIIGTNIITLNSGVTSINPLPPSFGTYCRRFSGSNTSLLISPAYAGGAFVGIPSSNIIRTSLAFKKWFNNNYYNAGVVAKYTNAASPGYSICYDSIYQEIMLMLNDGTRYSLGLTFPPGGGINDTWFNMRMDIEETSPGVDRILVSQEYPIGSNSWNYVSINSGAPATGISFNSSQPQYAPWGGATRNGIVGEILSGYTAGGIFFDKYQIELF